VSPYTILYINGTAELGGTDTDLFATVQALDKTRFTPIVLLPHRGPFDEAYAAMGVEVLHAPLPVINRAAHPAQLVARAARSVRGIYRLIHERGIDLVYTNSLLVLSGGIAARLAGRPTLWHSGEFLDRPRLVGEALYWITASLATRIIVSSAAVRQRFPAWSRHKVEVVHNGIDLSRFRPDLDGKGVRDRLGIPASVPVVGFVGRFIPWKGVDHFVRIAARVRDEVPDAHFLIVGSRLAGYGEYAESVRVLIDELGLASRTTVLEDRLDVPELLAAMDVFVHCSLRPEPFGIVLVEAMAAAKPVVAVNAGGVPEIITGPEVGELVPIGDADASARAVIRLLRDADRASALGRAARAHVQQGFEVHAVTRRAETIYTSVLPVAGATGASADADRIGFASV
jgi:glycosyltransferase involved in cell wall biosynthesis